MWFNTPSIAPGGEQYWSGGKLLAVVQNGATVTVAVPTWERQWVSLLYDPSSFNQTDWYRVRDGQYAVTFQGCGGIDSPWPGNETQFNGGMIVAGTRCVVLDVYSGGSDPPPRMVLWPELGNCGPPGG
jgi:hypothetical protein